jgi:hypothetical protein
MDYEKISASEVQRLARQGDRDALYEMVWRHEEFLPAGDRNNPAERCAWQDYWFEKAAGAGIVDAKSRYANSLVDRVMNAEDRQKAMSLFQSLADALKAGKLSEAEKEDGTIAELRLGIMLCEGYGTPRDAVKGAALIKSAEAGTNGFNGFGFSVMLKLGELFAAGLAQPGEEPSIADLEQAVKYIAAAVKRFNPERDDPERLKLAKQLWENSQKRIATKMAIKSGGGQENLVFPGADERRKKMMELSVAARQRMEADKAALKRLRERLAREGW